MYAKLDAAATKRNLTIEGNRVGEYVGDKVELYDFEKGGIAKQGMGVGSDGNLYISKEALEHFKKVEKGGQSGLKKGGKVEYDNIIKPYTGPSTGYKSKVEVGELNKGVVLSGEAKATIVNTINKGNIDEIIKVFNKEANWDISKALNKVPDHVKKAGAEPSKSLKSQNPNPGIKFDGHKRDKIRIMKGKADAKWPSQQVDYVKVVSGGKMLDKFGVMGEPQDIAPAMLARYGSFVDRTSTSFPVSDEAQRSAIIETLRAG